MLAKDGSAGKPALFTSKLAPTGALKGLLSAIDDPWSAKLVTPIMDSAKSIYSLITINMG